MRSGASIGALLVSGDPAASLGDTRNLAADLVTSIADARERIAEKDFLIAILSIHLPDGPAFELARDLRALGIEIMFLAPPVQSILPADLTDVPFVNQQELRGCLDARVSSTIW